MDNCDWQFPEFSGIKDDIEYANMNKNLCDKNLIPNAFETIYVSTMFEAANFIQYMSQLCEREVKKCLMVYSKYEEVLASSFVSCI